MTAWMDFVERDNSGLPADPDLGNSYNDWLAPGDDERRPSCWPPPTGPTTPR